MKYSVKFFAYGRYEGEKVVDAPGKVEFRYNIAGHPGKTYGVTVDIKKIGYAGIKFWSANLHNNNSISFVDEHGIASWTGMYQFNFYVVSQPVVT